MVHAVGCPRCHRPVPADAPFGSCPACLLLLGLADTPDGRCGGTVAVTVAAATDLASGFASADPDATLSQTEGAAPAAYWPVIPGHRIVSELGAGGGGAVYLAEQLGAGRRLVAVKVLHGTSRTERERLGREARSLGRLTHPNVVTLFEVGESAAGPFFTMEYVSGGSLADRIRTKRPEPADGARIVEAIARAVQAAHEHGIRHRDLKPSNVLMEKDGTPKVADFGLAKLTETAGGGTTEYLLTHTNHLLGTPAYMAPEQAGRRHGEVSDRTDVYGIGAILYHCLTGRPPFQGLDRDDTLAKVRAAEVSFPTDRGSRVPRELEAVCRKCLEKDPGRRYETAGELAGELACWARGEPTRVRPTGPVRRAWRAVKPQLSRVATAAAVVGLLAIAAAVGRSGRDRPDPKADEAAILDQIGKDIAAGGEVDLVPDGGSPRYARWLGEAIGPSRSTYNDDVFSMAGANLSRVELLPAALVPAAYRLTAVVRHDDSPHENSCVGFYFGHQGEDADGGRRLEWGLDVVISDFPPEQGSHLGIKKNWVHARPWAALLAPNRPPNWSAGALVGCPMPSPDWIVPRGWRTIIVECRRGGLGLWWVDGGNRISARRNPLPSPLIVESLAAARAVRWPGRRANDTEPAAWAAGGIGAVAVRGQVSVRRLTMTPLEDE